ncbi:hypothetical protein LCGC14_2006700, partial [marine sediment metagenome]
PTTGQFTPHAAVELRWPLQRSDPGGVSHLLEPVAQFAWSETSGNAVPNEDSVLVEFDEGNLFSLSRYPGLDALEQGARANLGLRYTRHDPDGWSLGLTVGRILRSEADPRFADGTGLSGDLSDWLVAGKLELDDRLTLTNRALFDDGFDFSKNEARIAFDSSRATIATTYVWLEAVEAENRPTDTHEIALDGAYRFGRNWTGTFDGRYDLVTDQTARTGLGLEYQSECLTVDFSLSRRFTSSTNVSPSTDFGLQLSLAGFGSGRNAQAAKSCNG